MPSRKKARKTVPGCHVAEADGPATAAATGAPTAAGPESPTRIALAVGRTALAAARAATPAPARDTAAAGREPDGTAAWRAARLTGAAEGRRAAPLVAVADAPLVAAADAPRLA